MKKVHSLLLVLLLPLLSYADDYKILHMNSSVIKIGDRVCKIGDVFSDNDIIYWEQEKQAFKAQNTTSKVIRLFAEPEFKQSDVKTVKDYFLRKGRLSTRASMSLSELEDYLSDEFLLLDSICVETTEVTDSQHYFLLSYTLRGKTINKRLKGEDGKFYIERSLFPKKTPASAITVSVSYMNEKIEEVYQLNSLMRITLLPLKVR